MCINEIQDDPVVRIRLHEIIEALRLERVEIRNLPVQEYAQYLINHRIGISTFQYFVPVYTTKQPYFLKHISTLFDTVIDILIEQEKVLEEKYERCKEYPR